MFLSVFPHQQWPGQWEILIVVNSKYFILISPAQCLQRYPQVMNEKPRLVFLFHPN